MTIKPTFMLYHNGETQNPKKAFGFNQAVEITSAEKLRDAARFDHIAAKTSDGTRQTRNFTTSDVVMLDVDNEHATSINDATSIQQAFAALPNVEAYAVTSKSHMKPKGDRPAVPRFHLYLPTATISDAAKYVKLKKDIAAVLDFVDGNALDATRYFNGNQQPEVFHQPGRYTIDQYLTSNPGLVAAAQSRAVFEAYISQALGEEMPEGNRNTALHQWGAKLIKRLGANQYTEQALYEKNQASCVPPLQDDEVAAIYRSLQRWYTNQVANNPDYIPPTQWLNCHQHQPKEYTDLGFCEVLASFGRDRIVRHIVRGWAEYDGARWYILPAKTAPNNVFHELTSVQLQEAKNQIAAIVEQAPQLAGLAQSRKELPAKQLAALDEETAAHYQQLVKALRYLKAVENYRNSNRINAVMDQVRYISPIKVQGDVFDTQEELLNTPAGVYDLTKGVAGKQDHNPRLMLTKITAASPTGVTDEMRQKWAEALTGWFPGSDGKGDHQLIDYVQKIIGRSVYGAKKDNVFTFATGTGRNGKSSFFEALAAVLGDYAGTIDSKVLVASKNPDANRFELGHVAGVRLLLTSELQAGVTLDEKALKKLASIDRITIERKNQDVETITPTFDVILSTNHLPKVNTQDYGTWRRIEVIPFLATFPDSTDKKAFLSMLTNELAPAIMEWIIEGAKKAHDDSFSFQKPAAVQAATSDYRQSEDTLQRFVDSCLLWVADAPRKDWAAIGEVRDRFFQFCGFDRETRNRYSRFNEFSKDLQRCTVEGHPVVFEEYRRVKKLAGVVFAASEADSVL